jgi:hypothetical protein
LSIIASLRAAGFVLAAFFVLEYPQFRPPIRKREAQSFQIGMPRANLRLDFRDIAVAAISSNFEICRETAQFTASTFPR